MSNRDCTKCNKNTDEEETYSAREMELRSRSEGMILEKVLYH